MADCLMDSGNTRVKFARREANGWQYLGAIDLDETYFVEQALALFEAQSFERVFIATVSKAWRAEQLQRFLARLSIPVTQIESMDKLGRLQIAYTQPRLLGVDRFLAMLAAAEFQQHCAILSFGTALTMDVIGEDGIHRGGIIAPSSEFIHRAMQDYFPNVFTTTGEAQIFAKNTEDALRSGIEHQVLGMVQRVLSAASDGTRAKLVVTGGGAPAWLEKLPVNHEYVPEIIFQGMLRYIELSGL